MIQGAPEYKDVLTKMLEFISDDVLIAHNASFDMGVLTASSSTLPGTRLEEDTIRITPALSEFLSHNRGSQGNSTIAHAIDVLLPTQDIFTLFLNQEHVSGTALHQAHFLVVRP
jgi:DNA polymerase III alpha subunit (gram-positive type)